MASATIGRNSNRQKTSMMSNDTLRGFATSKNNNRHAHKARMELLKRGVTV